MAGRLTFAIAVKLVQDGFKSGVAQINASIRSMQYNVMAFAGALGAGGIGLSGLLSKMVKTARETNQVRTALKNISTGAGAYASNLKYLIGLSDEYGQELNTLTGAFAKFSAAAESVKMPMEQQRHIFSSMTRAMTAFGLGGSEANLTMMAISQMMSKGKISAEELRRQLGERMPIAMEAMAQAAGVPIEKLDDLLKKGALLSKDVLPMFAERVESMLPNVDTDHLETSFSRLQNKFIELTDRLDIKGKLKSIVDGTASALDNIQRHAENLVAVLIAFVGGRLGRFLHGQYQTGAKLRENSLRQYERAQQQMTLATQRRVAAESRLAATSASNKVSYLAAEMRLRQAANAEIKAQSVLVAAQATLSATHTGTVWGAAAANIKLAFTRAALTIKAAFASFLPMAVFTAITWIITKVIQARQEAKKLANIYNEFKDRVAEADTGGQEAARLKALNDAVQKTNEATKERKGLIDQVNKSLGTSFSHDKDILRTNRKISAEIGKQVELIKLRSKADRYAQESDTAEQEVKKIYGKYGGKDNFDRITEALVKRGEARRGLSDLTMAERYGSFGNFSGVETRKDKRERAFSEADKGVKEAFSAAGLKETFWGFFSNGLEGGYQEDAAKLRQFRAILKESNDQLTEIAKRQAEMGPPADSARGLYSAEEPEKAKAKETELQAAEREAAERLKALNNRRELGLITEAEYNNELKDLNKETANKIAALLGTKALENETYKNARAQIEEEREASKARNEHIEKSTALSNLKRNGIISEKEYNKRMDELNRSTAERIGQLSDLNEEERAYVDNLKAQRGKFRERPKMEARDTTFDYKKSEVQIKSEELERLKAHIKDFENEIASGLTDAEGELDALIEKSKNLEEALRITRVREDVRKLKKELQSGIFDNIKKGASFARNLQSAFRDIKNAFSDKDISPFERFLNIVSALATVADGVSDVIQMITTLTGVIKTLTAAKQVEAAMDAAKTGTDVANASTSATAQVTAAGAKVAASKAVATAAQVEAGALMFAAHAAIPFAGAAIASSQVAIMESVLAALAIPKFAGGGIVPGNSFSGDKVLSRLNSGEMVLNHSQQARLWRMVNGVGGGRAAEPVIVGGRITMDMNKLVVALEKQGRRNKRT